MSAILQELRNKIQYKEGEDGMLYPDFPISSDPEADARPLGQYAQMHLMFLKEHLPNRYTALLAEGELLPTCHRVGDETNTYIDRLVEQMLTEDPIPDPMNFMEATRHRNEKQRIAEEIALKEIVYQPEPQTMD